ncbi:MAG: helicase-related protein [Candidatus Hodarchaeales archaeon]|jgi:ERCC4-related helicase
MEILDSLFRGLTIEKRDYQLQAVQEILSHHKDSQSILLNYPYGTGKTIIALLVLLKLRMAEPGKQFIFTSAREAAGMRCRQAVEMGKEFGFVDKLGYLFNPQTGGKGLNLSQKMKMYQASQVIFSPIQTLMNDRFQIKSRLKVDIFSNMSLCIVDEATDLIARSMSGFRLSKYFQELFQVRKKNNFPILAMSGTRDQHKAKYIMQVLGEDAHQMSRLDLSPYETITQIKPINREDYIHNDQTISNLLTKPVGTIQEILDPNLSRLEIVKLSYGGALDRLRGDQSTYPIKLGKHRVKTNDDRIQLINAFALLFKLTHARLLLLESTPGEYLKYTKKEENKEVFSSLLEVSSQIISYRVNLPRYDKPEEVTTRGLIHPKVEMAINIIHEHIIRGAKVLLFTRYLALGEQLRMILETLQYPGIKYLSGKTKEESRHIILDQFRKEDVNVLIFTPVGGRGLNLEEADVVIHLDITSNLDDMTQRRERARGCIEYVLVLQGTSEEGKVKEYAKLTNASTVV